jgi:2'-hydroxyisoflavone reductase
VRVLILGGTKFLGIHLTHELRARGHDITHFNRGVTRSDPVDGVRTYRGDRSTDLSALEAERFDAVVDTSGYVPHVVERSARFFSDRANRYVFVSTISVYDEKLAKIDEDSPRIPLPDDAARDVMTPETYGPLKALCEDKVTGALADRATIVRPGLIVGPDDPTDRFTYWPLRFERGGDVLAPGTPHRTVQFIDVRDLAGLIATLIGRDASGDYNAVTPPNAITMGDVMNACANASRAPSSVIWVDDEFLLHREVEPWMGLPLWIPPALGMPGFYNVGADRSIAAGMSFTPLAKTVADTLAWAKTLPSDRVPRAGITAEREAELLAAFG